jgi:hypothetical protein
VRTFDQRYCFFHFTWKKEALMSAPSAADVPLLRPATQDQRATAALPREPDDPRSPPDDSQRLMVLLVVFVVSPLVVVAALWAAAVIDTPWGLAVALGVYVVTTLVVFVTVAFVMSGDVPSSRRRRHGT